MLIDRKESSKGFVKVRLFKHEIMLTLCNLSCSLFVSKTLLYSNIICWTSCLYLCYASFDTIKRWYRSVIYFCVNHCTQFLRSLRVLSLFKAVSEEIKALNSTIQNIHFNCGSHDFRAHILLALTMKFIKVKQSLWFSKKLEWTRLELLFNSNDLRCSKGNETHRRTPTIVAPFSVVFSLLAIGSTIGTLAFCLEFTMQEFKDIHSLFSRLTATNCLKFSRCSNTILTSYHQSNWTNVDEMSRCHP